MRESCNERYREVVLQACRWYLANQNTNQNPWGGIAESADLGRFVYEWFPAEKRGRGGVVWSQALGIMALHSANLMDTQNPVEEESLAQRTEAMNLASRYMMLLQFNSPRDRRRHGGFAECVPNESYSFPRDAATGGMGLCAMYRITGESRFIEAAIRFAEWYRKVGTHPGGWPVGIYDFNKCSADEKFNEPGDWQFGGALFYYYLAACTGKRKYITRYMLPMIEALMEAYRKNPPPLPPADPRIKRIASMGNDDFALITLMAAYVATGRKSYYHVVRQRIRAILPWIDSQTGQLPRIGGTMVGAITLRVFLDLEKALGNNPEGEFAEAIALLARAGMTLQAWDPSDVRVHGGFWGQSSYGVARNHIHHRSTGYAAIFYAMLAANNPIPYYHCLHWDVPGSITAQS